MTEHMTDEELVAFARGEPMPDHNHMAECDECLARLEGLFAPTDGSVAQRAVRATRLDYAVRAGGGLLLRAAGRIVRLGVREARVTRRR